jgi:hypothetical protein
MLGAGETLGMVETVTKPRRLMPPVGLDVADALSQKLPLLRGVKEPEVLSEGEAEGLGEKDSKDENVLTALLVPVALTQPVKLGVAEPLAVSDAEAVSVAVAEEQGEEEGESRWLRELVLLACAEDERVAVTQEEALTLPHLPAAAPTLGLWLPETLSLCESVGEVVEEGQAVEEVDRELV